MTRWGVAAPESIEQVVRDVAEQFFAYSLHKPHRPIAYWHRMLYFAARNTPRWAKTLLKRNMTKTLGTVLDYKGVAFSDALVQLRDNGVEFNSEEMKELCEFLQAFHSTLES